MCQYICERFCFVCKHRLINWSSFYIIERMRETTYLYKLSITIKYIADGPNVMFCQPNLLKYFFLVSKLFLGIVRIGAKKVFYDIVCQKFAFKRSNAKFNWRLIKKAITDIEKQLCLHISTDLVIDSQFFSSFRLKCRPTFHCDRS